MMDRLFEGCGGLAGDGMALGGEVLASSVTLIGTLYVLVGLREGAGVAAVRYMPDVRFPGGTEVKVGIAVVACGLQRLEGWSMGMDL